MGGLGQRAEQRGPDPVGGWRGSAEPAPPGGAARDCLGGRRAAGRKATPAAARAVILGLDPRISRSGPCRKPCERRPAGWRMQRPSGCAPWSGSHLSSEVCASVDAAPARGDGPALARRLRLDSVRGAIGRWCRGCDVVEIYENGQAKEPGAPQAGRAPARGVAHATLERVRFMAVFASSLGGPRQRRRSASPPGRAGARTAPSARFRAGGALGRWCRACAVRSSSGSGGGAAAPGAAPQSTRSIRISAASASASGGDVRAVRERQSVA